MPAVASAPLDDATWHEGWHRNARRVASPNFGKRPPTDIDLIVVHAISLPAGQYGGDAIERLFTNRLDWSAHADFECIRGLKVSAHFLIRRDGELVQFVSVLDRAWHAGKSSWAGRENCNDFSVGIELEGLDGQSFDAPQYAVLARLVLELARAWPIRRVLGHEDVAPGRKFDPGAGFEWLELARATSWPLAEPGLMSPRPQGT